MAQIDRISFTSVRESDYRFPDSSVVVYGTSVEERSEFAPTHLATTSIRRFEIQNQTRDDFTWSGPYDSESGRVRLRSESDLSDFVRGLGESVVVDLTGLSHHIWAPLIRTCLGQVADLRGLYVEPMSYKRHHAPTEYELFDLSERIEGIAPIPGFATLGLFEDFILAPLLGFEGRRLAYVLETVQPPDDRIHPIVGVPGFRPEFPFYAFEGNHLALEDSGALARVSYARANCPFSLYYALEDLASFNPNIPILVALIGTKPHSLGGVLFALLSNHTVEIIYDYPVRKTQRTAGAANVLEYHLSSFADWIHSR